MFRGFRAFLAWLGRTFPPRPPLLPPPGVDPAFDRAMAKRREAIVRPTTGAMGVRPIGHVSPNPPRPTPPAPPPAIRRSRPSGTVWCEPCAAEREADAYYMGGDLLDLRCATCRARIPFGPKQQGAIVHARTTYGEVPAFPPYPPEPPFAH